MSTPEVLRSLREGETLRDALQGLSTLTIDGNPARVQVESQVVPYLAHVIDGVTDGPAVSKVEALVSGREPGTERWRRFTVTRQGPSHFRVSVFPTPFGTKIAPLAPGIPPSGTRHGHA